MATKKTDDMAVESTAAENLAAVSSATEIQENENPRSAAPSAKVAPAKEEMVPVLLFKDNERYADDVIVAVNGKAYQIRRGERVMVPKSVKEVLDNSYAQDLETARYQDRLQQEFADKSKALGL